MFEQFSNSTYTEDNLIRNKQYAHYTNILYID